MSKQPHASRLVDRVREGLDLGFRSPFGPSEAVLVDAKNDARRIQRAILGAPTFVADNIAEYVSAPGYQWQGRTVAEMCPSMRPSHDPMFIEWTWSHGLAGILVWSTPMTSDYRAVNPAATIMLGIATVFWMRGGGPANLSMESVVCCIDDEGTNHGGVYASHIDPRTGRSLPTATEDIGTLLADILPGMLCMTFLNCRNASVAVVDPPAALNKSRKLRGKPPLSSYHTLDIRPMQLVLKHEGGIETNGLKKALHICRGHFKDYRQGNGLFGRTKGLFWVDAHERGNEELGKVEKTYRVHPPEAAND